MHLAPDQRILHYRLVETIGKGGMGVVWRAQDSVLDRPVALKFLPQEALEDSERLARFRREAKLLASLNHPSVAVVHGLHEADGVHFLAMELVEGEDLSDAIARGPLGAEVTEDLGRQIAQALAAAHAQGIVHRDLKPANVRLLADGRVKVLDFGLATLFSGPHQAGYTEVETLTRLTRNGLAPGTPAYMAPEQLRGETANPKSDLFALGLVLYEVASGTHPFARSTIAETVSATLRDRPEPLSTLLPGFPGTTADLVDELLERDPERRPESAAEVVRRLSQGPLGASTVHGAGASSKPRSVVLISLLALLAIVAIGLSSFLLRRPSTGPIELGEQRLLANAPGSVSGATLSPDGNFAVFVETSPTGGRLRLMNLLEGEPITITPAELDASRPRWSPVNDRILFTVGAGSGAELWTVPPVGGEPRRLLPGARHGSWSPDGTRIVFERVSEPGFPLWTADAAGENAAQLVGVPSADVLLCTRDPVYSPDGDWVAFFHCPRSPLGDLWIVPSVGGEARRLTNDETFGSDPVWTPDGRSIVYSSSRRGSRTLWQVAVDDGAHAPVLLSPGDDTEPALSSDGRRLVYTNTRKTFRLVRLDPDSAESKTLHTSRAEVVDPSFSPDGSRIAFFGLGSHGGFHVLSIDGERGGALRQITQGRGDVNVHPGWSADGETLYYYRQRPDPSFRRISSAGGPSEVLIDGWDRQTQNGARVSPGGDRVVYTEMRAGRPAATRIRRLTTGAELPFHELLRYPRWSADGSRLVGSVPSERSAYFGAITECLFDPAQCRETGGHGAVPRYSADGRSIYFLRWKEKSTWTVWRVPAGGGDAEVVADIGPLEPFGSFFDVDPAGRILFVEYQAGRSELWLAEVGPSVTSRR